MHNALGGGRARRLAVEDPSRGLMPWVGVAAALDRSPAPSLPLAVDAASTLTSGSEADASGTDRSSSNMVAIGAAAAGTPSGRAFCFLPLPIYTGMPARVHINGYFELSSNRRDIWCGTCTPQQLTAKLPHLEHASHAYAQLHRHGIGCIPKKLQVLSWHPCTCKLATFVTAAACRFFSYRALQ